MFTGFTDETVDFMWGIPLQQRAAWFEAHKEIYLTHFLSSPCGSWGRAL